MILLKNVTKTFGTFTAVNNLNIEMNSGNVIGLIGPNGAGKTSTINMIVGLSKPTTGSIEMFGKKMNEDSIDIKQYIGYVSDNSNRFLKLKGIEYLNFIADIYKISKDERKESIIELAKNFEMTDHLEKKSRNTQKE